MDRGHTTHFLRTKNSSPRKEATQSVDKGQERPVPATDRQVNSTIWRNPNLDDDEPSPCPLPTGLSPRIVSQNNRTKCIDMGIQSKPLNLQVDSHWAQRAGVNARCPTSACTVPGYYATTPCANISSNSYDSYWNLLLQSKCKFPFLFKETTSNNIFNTTGVATTQNNAASLEKTSESATAKSGADKQSVPIVRLASECQNLSTNAYDSFCHLYISGRLALLRTTARLG